MLVEIRKLSLVKNPPVVENDLLAADGDMEWSFAVLFGRAGKKAEERCSQQQ